MDDTGGIWRTVGGRRIFIKDGQDLATAMKESGKFKSQKEIEYEERKQRENWSSNNNSNNDNFHKEEREYIKTNTGVNDDEALEIYGAIAHYTTSGYDDIRDVKVTSKDVVDERNNIERYIEHAPKFNGEVYRGISFKDDDFVNKLEVDKVIDMKGISSWSADANTAKAFSERYNKKNQVVFSLKNKTGVDISKISAIPEEKEVLHSSKTFYRIASVDKKTILNQNDKYLWSVELEEL